MFPAFILDATGRVKTLPKFGRGVEVLPTSLADVTVANTTTETTIFSILLPPNALGSGNAIRATLAGTIKQDAAGARDLTTRVQLGISPLFGETNSISNGLGVAQNWQMNFLLLADGSLNLQECSIFAYYRRAEVVNTFVEGFGSASENSTAALLLDFSIEWGVANADLIFVFKHALVEILKV